MSAMAIDQENLETRVYEHDDHLTIGGVIKIRFVDKEGKIVLRRGIRDKVNHIVEVVMPWGNIYTVARYNEEGQAKQTFESYCKALENGCTISITGLSTAVIYPKSSH